MTLNIKLKAVFLVTLFLLGALAPLTLHAEGTSPVSNTVLYIPEANSTLNGSGSGFPTSSFTIEGYVYLPSYVTEDDQLAIFSKKQFAELIVTQTGSYYAFEFARYSDSTNYKSITSYLYKYSIDNDWHHIAATYDSSDDSLHLYLDGVQILPGSSSTGYYVDPPDGTIKVGGLESYGFGYFDYYIDEVRVSSTLRYSGDFSRPTASFSSDGSTVALWHFDESAGSTTFNDSSASGISLSAVNGATTVQFNPTLSLTAPNGGESWSAGSSQTITWATSDLAGTVALALYKGGALSLIISSATSNDGTYSWTIPEDTIPGDDYQILIVSNTVTSLNDASEAPFSITQAPPTITTHPTDQAVNEGETATFSVIADGTGLLYQWQKDRVDITGATSTSYTTPAAAMTDDQTTYRCVVANSGGSVSSDAATLTVSPNPPTITSQPADQTVTEGETATFVVTATGYDLSYQWQKDGSDITGATSASYTTPATTMADDQTTYGCVVTNSGGSVTSSTATLTVNMAPPVISSQPVDQTVTEGQSGTFFVTATGTDLSYQWRENGSPIPGALSASYTTPAVSLTDDQDSFDCVISNNGGSITSDNATLTVELLPPTITSQPANQSVTEGETATFSVSAAGTDLSFQWQKGTSDIPGATSASYTTPATTMADDQTGYRCVVTNSGGSVISDAATLTVNMAPPSITTQPADQTTTEGSSAVFSASASGTDISYQWQRNGSDIAAATGSSYTTPATTIADDQATFRCVVSNSGGTATSTAATLTVELLPPSINTQPDDQTVVDGQNATFFISAGGTAISYQWHKNDVVIPGATQASYTTPSTSMADDQTTYGCLVTNSGGSVTSDDATLTVTMAPPVITGDPADQSVYEGQAAGFTVSATGTALGYQWHQNDIPIAGADSSTYTTPPTALADDQASFRCVVSNAMGTVTSNPATLSVTMAPPAISSQPADQNVLVGERATFTIAVSGHDLSYQWQKNDAEIPGATEASYITPPTTLQDHQATFRCVVTNSQGSTTSSRATLNVLLEKTKPFPWHLFLPAFAMQPSM